MTNQAHWHIHNTLKAWCCPWALFHSIFVVFRALCVCQGPTIASVPWVVIWLNHNLYQVENVMNFQSIATCEFIISSLVNIQSFNHSVFIIHWWQGRGSPKPGSGQDFTAVKQAEGQMKTLIHQLDSLLPYLNVAISSTALLPVKSSKSFQSLVHIRNIIVLLYLMLTHLFMTKY